MKKRQTLFACILCAVFTLTTQASFTECHKSEVFNAYGFYGEGGFPESSSLMGPFLTFDGCQTAQKKYSSSK